MIPLHSTFSVHAPHCNDDGTQSEVKKLPQLIDKWVGGYKWREKVRHAKHVDLTTPEVRPRSIIIAYMVANVNSNEPTGNSLSHVRVRRSGLYRRRTSGRPRLDSCPCACRLTKVAARHGLSSRVFVFDHCIRSTPLAGLLPTNSTLGVSVQPADDDTQHNDTCT